CCTVLLSASPTSTTVFSTLSLHDALPIFEYLKYYGRRLADDLEQTFPCQVHVHRGSAFLMQGEECRMGEVFPGNTGLSDVLLFRSEEHTSELQSRFDLVCRLLLEKKKTV